MKMVSAVCLTLILAFTSPFSAFANSGTFGAGEWDDLGQFGMTYVTYEIVHSGGGNFKVCISDSGHNSYTYTLKEMDESGNPPETVGSKGLSQGQCKVFDVRNYVDGSNNQAELALTKGNDAYVVVHFYD